MKLNFRSAILALILFGVPLPAVYAQTITTFAGNYVSGNTGNGGPATSAKIGWPRGVAIDASGNVYFSDNLFDVIRKVNPSGTISTIAGIGTAGYTGDGGAATAAQLNEPIGLAVDGFSNLYISDVRNNVIRKVNTSGVISTVAGNGTRGYSGDGGPATAARLNGPADVAFDAAGNLYISDGDSNNVIRKVNTAGIISTFAGNGTYGYSGDGGPATAAQLYSPFGISFDVSGNLYIADYFNNVIRMVTKTGIISTYAGNGYGAGTTSGGNTGDGGPATNAELLHPMGVSADIFGNIYITENIGACIKKVNASGTISTFAGTYTVSGSSGDGGPAAAALLNFPTGVGIDGSGAVFVADQMSSAVRKITMPLATSANQLSNTTFPDLEVFPNPSNGCFTIRTPETKYASSIIITDILGKTIETRSSCNSNKSETVINVNIPAGTYFIKADCGNVIYRGTVQILPQ